MGDRGSLRVEIQLPRVFHIASKSGSTCEPWWVYGINTCGSIASDGVKLNMMKMEKAKIYKIK